ncbi:UNKNOWN [Stylonychia lemnae]|uniref:Uncharacterized protein n=1 Tax=Stylonychia lemnae TaxID=5949 RepID=A0A078B9V5_STYLE|nr:UNKNOWN [Stylonychia lemnae]|eukprot:CDW90991.1 UNKNOWN [Stylonychia lemnae]
MQQTAMDPKNEGPLSDLEGEANLKKSPTTLQRFMKRRIKSKRLQKPSFILDSLAIPNAQKEDTIYDSLRDQHLIRFFERKQTFRNLIRQGLIDKNGTIIEKARNNLSSFGIYAHNDEYAQALKNRKYTSVEVKERSQLKNENQTTSKKEKKDKKDKIKHSDSIKKTGGDPYVTQNYSTLDLKKEKLFYQKSKDDNLTPQNFNHKQDKQSINSNFQSVTPSVVAHHHDNRSQKSLEMSLPRLPPIMLRQSIANVAFTNMNKSSHKNLIKLSKQFLRKGESSQLSRKEKDFKEGNIKIRSKRKGNKSVLNTYSTNPHDNVQPISKEELDVIIEKYKNQAQKHSYNTQSINTHRSNGAANQNEEHENVSSKQFELLNINDDHNKESAKQIKRMKTEKKDLKTNKHLKNFIINCYPYLQTNANGEKYFQELAKVSKSKKVSKKQL